MRNIFARFNDRTTVGGVAHKLLAASLTMILLSGFPDVLRGADPLPFVLAFPPVDGAKAYEVQWLKGPVADESAGSAGPIEKFEKPPFEKVKVGSFTHFRVRSLGPFGVPGRWSKPRPVPDFQKARVLRKDPEPVKRPPASKPAPQPPVRKKVAGFVDVPNGEGRPERYYTGRALALGAADSRSGVRSIFYRVNAGPFRKYAAPISVARDGVYRLRFYALDRAGNRESVQYLVFRVDRTAPVVGVTFRRRLVKNKERLFSGPVNAVEFRAHDDGAGLKEIRYRVFADPAQPGRFKLYNGPLNFNELIQDGHSRRIIEYYALDKLGNRSKVSRVTILRR